jgi:pyrroline-5-carboxylate reductase
MKGDTIMEKIGFIGYGSMGKVILDGFLLSEIIRPSDVIISSRTESKLKYLEKEYPEIEISPNNINTTKKSNLLFLMVGTSDVKDVIEEIKDFTSKNTHIVYISAALKIGTVHKRFNGKISKVMPSLTSKVMEGVTLICHNTAVTTKEGERVNHLFNSIGEYKIIDEQDFDVGADITSCSPAFIARILMEFAKTASINSGFSLKETEEMVIRTLYGTSKILYEEGNGFENLISSVATKGGITEEGLKILEEDTPLTFNRLFSKTIEKHEIIESKLKEDY